MWTFIKEGLGETWNCRFKSSSSGFGEKRSARSRQAVAFSAFARTRSLSLSALPSMIVSRLSFSSCATGTSMLCCAWSELGTQPCSQNAAADLICPELKIWPVGKDDHVKPCRQPALLQSLQYSEHVSG